MAQKRHTNHLIKETSPYLLQHAHNPVDWYPWGKEALELAIKTGKPIFLSIGYSACHWCHVMERESFEDEETAALMNQHFINIKVDREERQDLDHIYMSAVQMMTQRGGWPMSVFLTPNLKPFYGGTYFPPDDRYGMPSFKKILLGVASAWKDRRAQILESAETLTNALQDIGKGPAAEAEPSLDLLSHSVQSLKANFDPENGGIGNAPKFFHVMDFRVALREWVRSKDADALLMVEKTLEAWSAGGIRDQLGGGFHRYSTDAEWLAPHFEKMLYDNALVTDLFLEAFQITGKHEYAAAIRHTLDFFLNEMQNKEGGFFSTLDADSEGEEGKFYVWSLEEVRKILPPDISPLVEKIWDVTASGNWEGKNILRRTKTWQALREELQLSEEALEDTITLARRKMLSARRARPAPFRDEKILTNWNGLFIDTLARASQVLGDSSYYEAAAKAADFFLSKVWDSKTGMLFHSYKDGKVKHDGFLDDYACLALSLLSLYETDFEYRWLEAAEKLANALLDRFYEPNEGKFYFTQKMSENLIVRPVEAHDGATPSASAMATTMLVRLWHFTDKAPFRKAAESVLKTYQPTMEKIPSAAGQFLVALAALIDNPIHFVIAKGKDSESFDSLLEKVRGTFLPNKAVLQIDSQKANPHFQGREPVQGKTTVYVCQGQTCLSPATTLQELELCITKLL